MQGTLERLTGSAMGRGVHVWCYGHWGIPIIAFPTAAGFAHEWERQSMVKTLSPFLKAGKIKLYCPESNISETWTDKRSSLTVRIKRHQAYESFIVDHLVPAIYRDCRTDGIPIELAGASLGAYYAANFALKYPHLFRHALCMSGRYRLTHFTGGQTNPSIYFNHPLAFVPNLDGESLERVQNHTHLTLVCGQGPYEEGCIEETILLADLLEAKDIPHTRDIWGHDVAHDWKWWKRQAVFHLQKRFG